MQVTNGTWCMRKQCVPAPILVTSHISMVLGSLSSSPTQEPGNEGLFCSMWQEESLRTSDFFLAHARGSENETMMTTPHQHNWLATVAFFPSSNTDGRIVAMDQCYSYSPTPRLHSHHPFSQSVWSNYIWPPDQHWKHIPWPLGHSIRLGGITPWAKLYVTTSGIIWATHTQSHA